MRCKNCGKEIMEYEIFCDKCKEELRNSSSKEEVDELEELINNHTDLNKLEDTKPLDDLNKLVSEELNSDNNYSETIEIDSSKIEETRLEKFENIEKEKKSKKVKIILISIISFILVVLIILIAFFLLRKKPEIKNDEASINYKFVLNQYGKSIELSLKKYMSEQDIKKILRTNINKILKDE